MTSKTRKLIAHVYLPGQSQSRPAGALELIEDGERLAASRFVYGSKYRLRDDAMAIDPVDLPLGPNTYLPSRARTQFGAIRDAAPDLWGRRVIEAKLRRPGPLRESDYLLHAGSDRVGALDFAATTDAPATSIAVELVDLAHLQDIYARIEVGEDVPAHLERLLDPGASMGGARPKATVVAEGKQWLAKFSSQSDRFDVPAVEAGTLELARNAGIQVPATKLIAIDGGKSVLLVQRFDRTYQRDEVQRVHFVSALTLLAKDESESLGSSYLEIVEALNQYGDPGHLAADRAEIFARMVLNIFVSNDDDHLRNHAFLWTRRGWKLSPLYDVVPRPQASLERSLHLVVGDRGREATLTNALSRAAAFGLDDQRARAIIDRVGGATREWKSVFESVGVPGTSIDRVASAFRKAADLGF